MKFSCLSIMRRMAFAVGCLGLPLVAPAQYTNGIYENPPVFKDGYLLMPDGPGLGVTINKDFIAR